MLPYLGVAYKLARCLQSDARADDGTVQRACQRALRTGPPAPIQASVERGFNILHGSNARMQYWAVSDAEPAQLQSLAQALQRLTQAPPAVTAPTQPPAR